MLGVLASISTSTSTALIAIAAAFGVGIIGIAMIGALLLATLDATDRRRLLRTLTRRKPPPGTPG